MRIHLLAIMMLLVPVVYAQDIMVGTVIVDTMPAAEQRLADSWDNIVVAYIRQDSRMTIIQGEILLEDDAAVIQRYGQGMEQMTDAQREERLKEAAVEITAELSAAMKAEEEAIPHPTEPIAPSPLCALLKDGVCERDCKGADLDCMCGDGLCQSYENRDTCPLDCKPGKNYLCAVARDNFCDPTCPGFDIDCKIISLIDTTMSLYAKDENFYTRTMTILSIVIMLLFGASMWLLHDIYNIRLRP